MCGICGFVHAREVQDSVLNAMNQTLRHRGPDDEGRYFDRMRDGVQVGLAQRRLSILDLSANGHQPMCTADSSCVITFNGEIYNFQQIRAELTKHGYAFVSGTDTEVILYAYKQWGIDCVKKFNGMFAFAIYDKDAQTLHLARDRMGVKPLYYFYNGYDLVFGSELKPILKYPYFTKKLNTTALNTYLACQYITGEESIFQDVYRLRPGHILTWHAGKISLSPYWSIENVLREKEPYAGDYEQAKAELKQLLLDAVSLRMISDVPLGAFLSNGVDSSLIVSLMQEVSPSPVKTFTIGFHEKQYNEAEEAAKVAKYLGTEHHEAYLSINEAKRYIEKIPYYCDEPMADSSVIPTMLVSEIARKEVKVVQSGDAGDELFFGYNSYLDPYRLKKFRTVSKVLASANKVLPLERAAVAINSHSLCKLFHLYDNEQVLNANLYTHQARYAKLARGLFKFDEFLTASRICREPEAAAMVRDMLTYLPDDILTKVDRASMSVSLETRAPFLDYRVVEMALRLPLSFKYSQGIRKRILKDILFSYVPEEMIGRNKRGFGIPFAQWLREDYQEMTRGKLEEEYIKKQDIFDWRVLQGVIRGFQKGKNPNFDKLLWTIFVFQLWYERMYENME